MPMFKKIWRAVKESLKERRAIISESSCDCLNSIRGKAGSRRCAVGSAWSAMLSARQLGALLVRLFSHLSPRADPFPTA